MYLLGEQPAHTETLSKRLQAIPAQLLDGLAPCSDPIEINNDASLETALASNQLFIIDSGLLHVFIEGRAVFYLQEGDLLGIQQGLELPDHQYSTEHPLRLTPYLRHEVFQHIADCIERQELYTYYLLGHSALLTGALVHLQQPQESPPSGFKRVAAGEELIRVGQRAEHVFIILEGQAEAWVHGQKVADIEQDEVFGAMAVFTDKPRNATVIAKKPCTVMMIAKDKFLNLMHQNPRIAYNLIENMAHRIDLMNKEITDYRKQLSRPAAD